MGINERIAAYLAAKEEEAAANKAARDAKKRADLAAAEIVRHADGRTGFETDMYTVALGTAARVILDTEAMYRDFPDIKDTYGRTSTRTTITALARQDATGKTA